MNIVINITMTDITPYSSTGIILPNKIDLRPLMQPVFKQGGIGSCTANALASLVAFTNGKEETFSRLFLYYGTRSLKGTITRDSGAQLIDGLKFLTTSGCCLEQTWPYNSAKVTINPTADAYTQALQYKIDSYYNLTSLDEMLDCLANGYPFVFGFKLYSSFESAPMARTGILNMPGEHEKRLYGHAAMAVGYDLTDRRWIVRNSWGDKWGQAGYFTMPFDYLIGDCWTIRQDN